MPVPTTASAATPSPVTALDAEDLELLRARWAEDCEDGRTRREEALARLAALRDDADAAFGPVDLRGLSLIGEDLSGLDLSLADLSHADLSRADLTGATLFRAKLVGATLFEARFEGAELSAADLTDADLRNARASRAGLGAAALSGADLSGAQLDGATLTDAALRGASLRLASLRGARLRDADLANVDLSKADLREAELNDADVTGATLDGADLRGAVLQGLTAYQEASWIACDVREIDFTGAYLCRRFILDQNFLKEFRDQGPWARRLYWVWSVTSDCGRSLSRWGLLTLANALAFAAIYSRCSIDYGDHPTWLSPLYYSVVTLTTLGYGDVLPASVPAQVAVMVQVTCGYVMLGGLLSIFSNKMARRAE